MKRYLPQFSVVLIVSLSLMGCYSEFECEDTLVTDRIVFYHLSEPEILSAKIEGYAQGSDFQDLVDSTYQVISLNLINDPYDLIYDGYLNKNLRTDLDYKITYPLRNSICYISDIRIREQVCKESLFSKEILRYYDGYYVNDTYFSCNVIKAMPGKTTTANTMCTPHCLSRLLHSAGKRSCQLYNAYTDRYL